MCGKLVRNAAVFLALLPLAAGCRKAKGTAAEVARREFPDSAAVYYYRLPSQGKFAEYVAAMHSCDGTPEEYRKRMETYLQDYYAAVCKEKGGGVSAVSVADKQFFHNGAYARVFLNVSYKDGTTEEVLFPMVFVAGKWRIQ